MEIFDVNKFIDNILSYTNSNGELLCSNKKQDLIYTDFDDIVPFLLYFKQQKAVKQQIVLSQKKLYKGFFPIERYLYSFRMDEYLGGILTYYEHTKDEYVKPIYEQQFDLLNSFYELKYFPTYIDIKTGKVSKSVCSRGYNLVEVILESSIPSTKFKNKTLEILDNFIDNNIFFNKNGLFLNKYIYKKSKFEGKFFNIPDFISFIGKSSYFKDYFIGNAKKVLFDNVAISDIKLMKDNSNLIFSIIEAFKFTGNEKYKLFVKKFIETVETKMFNKKGYVYTSFLERRGKSVLLTQNFTFLDILLDYFYYIENDKKIEQLIIKITEFWLSKKIDCGLIPDSPLANSNIFLDNQTDFSIVLKKVATITNNQKYYNAGKDLHKAIISNFYNGKYFYARLNASIVPLSDIVNVKYNLLFLKSYIAYKTELNPFNSIFKDR